MYQRILLPTDGSDGVTRAVEHALELADHYGATVHALSVIDATRLGLFTPTEADPGEVRASLRTVAEEATAEVRRRAEEAGVPVVTEVRVGIPHREILECAAENGVDLVVMGTHGRTGLEHALLGSVTERVLRAGEVPVMTVRM